MKRLLPILIIAGGIVLLEANPVEPAVLQVRPPGGTGTLGDVYTSIQQAIDEASPGDTISVAAGVYDGNTVGPEGHLIVDTANLTLKSTNGKDSTTIRVANGVGIDIRAGAENFVLGGADSNGFTIVGKADTTFVIQLTNAPLGVEISHNTIDTTGNASMGVSIGAAGASDLTISNNDFIAEDGDGSIWGPDVHNVTVSDNTFTGPATPTSGYAVQFAGVTSASPSTINGNTIDNHGSGIFIHTVGAATVVSGLTINDNSISGCSKGIRLGHSTQTLDMDDVTVTGNTLSNNTVGLYIDNNASIKADQFIVQYNCFNGNTAYGLQNEHATELVTAEKNAWSDPNGPYHPDTNPYASGDTVSDNVDYYPWYPDCTFTTLVYKPVHNVTLGAYYDTIQAALDEASSGDVIEADPGTYEESPNITQPVTLRSLSGKDVTSIVLQSGTNYLGSLTINASDVVVQGFTITGFDAVDSGLASSNIYITAGKSNIEVTECKLQVGKIGPGSNGDDGFGILTTYSPSNVGDNLNVHNNIIEPVDTEGARAFYINPGIDNFTFSDNVVDGNFVKTSITQAMNGTVEDNTFTGSGSSAGLGTWGYPDPGIWGHTDFVGNTITQTATAIALYDTNNVLVEDNTLSSNSYGLKVLDFATPTDASTIVLKCNRINGNSVFGVENTAATGTVDAELNWWGAADGPSGQGPGSGDAVSTNVDYFPWLLSTDCEDTAEVVADYVVDDDWASLPMYTQVFFDSTAYYIGLNAFDTIQGAVDAASDGNSIKVADGDYVGAIVDEDLMIIGANPGGSVITSGVPYKDGSALETAFRLDAGADGTEIKNFTVDCNMAENLFFAVFSRGVNDVIVDSLTVNKTVQGLTNWGGSNWQITNNVLNETGAASGGGIAILVGARPPEHGIAKGNIVKDNVMTPTATAPDYTCPAICVSLDVRSGYGDMTGSEDVSYNQIINNDITGTGLGSEVGIEVGVIGVSDDPNKIAATLGMVHDNLVRNNIIENTDWGVYFYTVTDLIVLGNELIDCNDGIHIEDSHEGTVINFNSIYGSSSYGVNNTGGVAVDATFNWWGDISGPNDPVGTSETDGAACYDVSTVKNADGAGDRVTDADVEYCPWLTAPVSPSDNPYMSGDVNYDGCINMLDVAILADEWLEGCE